MTRLASKYILSNLFNECGRDIFNAFGDGEKRINYVSVDTWTAKYIEAAYSMHYLRQDTKETIILFQLISKQTHGLGIQCMLLTHRCLETKHQKIQGTHVSETQEQNDDKLESPFNRTYIFYIASKQPQYLKLLEKI